MGCSPPQLRQRMPRIRRPAVVSGAGGVSIAMVILRRLVSAGTGVRATVWSDRGAPKGGSLIVQDDLPGLGTLPIVGRLSWLQRAGPSATLDKSSSVVSGCYESRAETVNEPAVATSSIPFRNVVASPH